MGRSRTDESIRVAPGNEREAMSAYAEQGYKNRREYLEGLADEHGVDRDTVFMMAGLLGPSEDFDGLVTAIEDYAQEVGQ